MTNNKILKAKRGPRPASHSGKSGRHKIMWNNHQLNAAEIEHWREKDMKRIVVTGHIDMSDPKTLQIDMLWKTSSSAAGPLGMSPLRKCAYCLRGP